MNIWKILLFLYALIHCNVLHAQSNQSKLEWDLQNHFTRLEYWNAYHEASDSVDRDDSLIYENQIISRSLLQYLKNSPITKFKRLGINITSSPDHNINIYSWDTQEGGTMVLENSVVQFKISGKYFDTLLIDADALTFYKIYELRNNGEVFYLCVGSGKLSTKDASLKISIYKIKNEQLIPANIIKTKTRFTNSIDFNYDFFQLDKQTQKMEIKFDNKKKEIYVPVVLSDGKMIPKYIIYKFNGSYFSKT